MIIVRAYKSNLFDGLNNLLVMNILYISTLVSEDVLKDLHNTSKIKPMYSIQKFHRLIVDGLTKNSQNVIALSTIPVSHRNHSRKLWILDPEKTNEKLKFVYIPFVNFILFRQVLLALYSFFYTLFWGIKKKENKRVLCDVLNISSCVGSLLACKLLKIGIAGIVTDMPGLMVNMSSKKRINRFISFVNRSYLRSFDYYIFLTEQMNEIINLKGKPYIVMEGLVDVNIRSEQKVVKSLNGRNIIYAGGLYEQYGVKMLLEAFMRLPFNDIHLSIYGAGQMEDDMLKYESLDNRIHYYGVVPNDYIVDEEIKATLLVNPRPTNESFTKYSFPSKNMEYMASGTPLLTTCLPGMPSEYLDYVYLFDEETIDGYADTLYKVLSKSSVELDEMGRKAQQFVLLKKNNIVQVRKMLYLLEGHENFIHFTS